MSGAALGGMTVYIKAEVDYCKRRSRAYYNRPQAFFFFW